MTPLTSTKKMEIVQFIEQAVRDKQLKKGDSLPSLSEIRVKFKVSRDTVFDAYSHLKSRGLIFSVVGKGYFLASENIDASQKIFVLFDELNAFKETLYKSFINGLSKNTEVEIFFHHFKKNTFINAIENSLGKYSHYVIMPASIQGVAEIIQRLPKNKVYVLDQLPKDLQEFPAIYQNFESGIFNGFETLKNKVVKYEELFLIFDSAIQPKGIRKGFTKFCETYGLKYTVLENQQDVIVKPKSLYLILDDAALISIVKQVNTLQLKIGVDVGIVAYNDTPLHEIIGDGITAISTDFSKMGITLAKMITRDKRESIENEISVIQRNSI